MGDMSKSIQPLVIDPSFMLCVHAAYFQITLCGTLAKHWSLFHLAKISTLKSYVDVLIDCQCFRFYLREDSSLIINPQSMQLQSWSSASSESSSAISTVLPFVHEVPWQWPQASVHFRPFLRQVHLAEVQPVVQSHQMTLSSSGGAGGRSVNTGKYPESVSFQPHDSSCKLQWGFFHWQVYIYTR